MGGGKLPFNVRLEKVGKSNHLICFGSIIVYFLQLTVNALTMVRNKFLMHHTLRNFLEVQLKFTFHFAIKDPISFSNTAR